MGDLLPKMKIYRRDLRSGRKNILQKQNGISKLQSRNKDIRFANREEPYFKTSLLPNLARVSHAFIQLESKLIQNIIQKGVELVINPLESVYDIAEDRLLRLVNKGLELLFFPPKHIISNAHRVAREAYLMVQSNKINSRIVKLYREGFSKFKIIELTNLSSEMVNQKLNEFYNTISQTSPVLIYNSSYKIKESMKVTNKQQTKSIDAHKASTNQDDSQESDYQSQEEEDDEQTEDELIEKIIYLRNQNLTPSQIASILKIEINALFYLLNLIKQYHLDKVEHKEILENIVPSVKIILQQHAQIINDEVINKLPKGKILSMDYLRFKTDLKDQKVRNVYRTELLMQTNLLLLAGYSKKTAAEMVGINVRNLHEIIKMYQLPNIYIGNHKLKFPIDNKLLAKQYQIPEKRVYDLFKYELLSELNDRLVAGEDVKTIAKDTGIYYRTALNWKKTYNLPNTKAYEGFSQPEVLYDHSWAMVEAGTIPHDEGIYRRSIQIGEEVGIIREDGVVVLAKELVGLTAEELKATGRYVMYNEQYQQVLSHIESVSRVEVDQMYRVQSTERNYVTLGPESRLIADDSSGVINIKLNSWNGQSVLVARSLEGLPSYMPTYFDLFYGLKVPLRMVITAETIAQIKIRLKHKYGNYKAGCKAMGINYRNFIEFRYLHHQDLVNLYNTFSYPDIKSVDFLKNVERLGIKGKKALIDNPLVTPELFYICGLIASDGYTLDQILNRKSVTGFNNKVLELVDNYIEILKSIFPERHVALRDPRPPEQVTYEAVTYNYALVRIINNMTVKGIDVNATNAYLKILRLPLESVGAFARGFFDGDGHVDLKAQMISIGIFSELRAKNFQLLLKRLSIDYSVEYSEGWRTPPRAEEPVWSEKWDIRISGKIDILRFYEIVGTNHPEKIEKFRMLVKRLNSQNSLTTQSRLAPKICGKYIKTLRQKANITQKQLDELVRRKNFSVELETGRKRSSNMNVMRAITYFNSNSFTAETKELNELKKIVNNNYILKNPELEPINVKTTIVRINTRNNLVIDNGLILGGITNENN